MCIGMGDRRLFNSSRTFLAEPDPNWNHIHAEQQPYILFGRVRAADSGSFASHVENMPIDEARSSLRQWHDNSTVRAWRMVPLGHGFKPCLQHLYGFWDPIKTLLSFQTKKKRSSLHSSLSINMELPYSQVPISSSSYSHESFRQLPATGSFFPVMQNSANSSSFSCQRSVIHGVAERIINPLVHNARGSFKRRRLPDSVINERGSTSGYTSAGGISDLPVYYNLPVGKPNLAPEQWPREIAGVIPTNRATTLSLGGENFERNVRSGSTLDLDVNLPRTCESNTLHHSSSNGRLFYHPGTTMGARPTTQENHVLNSVASHRPLVSDIQDAFRHETVNIGVTGPVDIHGYEPGHISRRNATVASQSLHTPVSHVVMGSHNNHRAQRSVPVSRSTHNYQHMGNATNFPPNTQQMAPSSSYSRPLSMISHNSDRSRRWGISTQRPHLLSGVADANNRLATQSFTTGDISAFYDSRNLFDQHRDMRLEIDDMSYEELLTLGESIGNVSTGISEGSMFKCPRETKHYSSSDQNQEEDTCVICLYGKKDKVAALMNCGHSYHASCIKKWLSTKNVCPICKPPALSDS